MQRVVCNGGVVLRHCMAMAHSALVVALFASRLACLIDRLCALFHGTCADHNILGLCLSVSISVSLETRYYLIFAKQKLVTSATALNDTKWLLQPGRSYIYSFHAQTRSNSHMFYLWKTRVKTNLWRQCGSAHKVLKISYWDLNDLNFQSIFYQLILDRPGWVDYLQVGFYG